MTLYRIVEYCTLVFKFKKKELYYVYYTFNDLLGYIECSLGDMLLIYSSFSKLTFPSLFFQHVVYITEIHKVPGSV